jgi:3-deoxy-D-manno-octulosonic-acid transferase
VLVVETEIWPNLYAEAERRQAPLMIVNARMTEESLRGYRLAGRLVSRTLARVDSILAQTESDASRYIERGARPDRVRVTGNLKFDITVPASLVESAEVLRAGWGVQRPTLVAGSTHEEDEAELFEAFLKLLQRHPQALLVLAPRHPERFGRVAQDARDIGLVTALRSEGAVPPRDAQCLVVDTMGELPRYYAAADVTFVGGTIAPVGGHNVLEPAALGKPILLGPELHHVEEIARQLLESGAAQSVTGRRDIETAVEALFTDAARRDRMGQAGLRLVREGRGALRQALEELDRYLPPAPVSPGSG